MTIVKFDHAVKYNGVRYDAHEVFKVEDKDVEGLKKSGVTVLAVEEPETPPADNPSTEGDAGEASGEDGKASATQTVEMFTKFKEELLEYTVPQMIKLATDYDIDLQGKTRKADIYNVIIETISSKLTK